MPEQIIPILGMIVVFSIPLSAIWTSHRRKMLEMQLRLRNEGDIGVRAAVDALREEVRALRDTTTQYDLSFDTALQRMERRVEGLERRVSEMDGGNITNVRAGG
ncbi:MAG TPA: hypothetical protein VKT32_07885 [Chthonomonadaceae bacterium]|nr:hypothetical protein [Chthonomonadaceae bacterium]